MNKVKDLAASPPPPHPSLSYLAPQPPLSGQSLYLGGECGPDGNIYCIPGHSLRVLVINPITDECFQIGPKFEGKFKWLRGICADNGVVYGLPCNSDSVLRIDATARMRKQQEGVEPSTSSSFEDVTISKLPLPFDSFFEDEEEREKERNMIWKYHGGAISPNDGCIYCIPQSATHVLRIDPRNDHCSFVGPKLDGKYKWYGGVIGKSDGALYGIPHNSGSVLRICPPTLLPETTYSSSSSNVEKEEDGHVEVSVTLHGDLGTSSHQWHGAGVSSDGTIVCIPANASTVLLIRPPNRDDDTNSPILEIIGGPNVVGTGSNAGRNDRKYKYLGSVSDKDCNVYCLPCGTERVLMVNTANTKVTEIGPSLYESGMERMKQNKWQNGFYSEVDQCIYAIPLAAETVLKIDLKNRVRVNKNDGSTEESDTEPSVSTMGLPSEPFGGLAKFEGGVMAPNKVMYCMPNNFKRVLRIQPGSCE